MNMTYKEIMPGIRLRVIESERFETNCFSVQFLAHADELSNSEMTLFPRVLRRGTVKHPDMESLAAALDDMYGARIEPVSRKYGDVITSGFICDFVEFEDKLLGSMSKLLGEVLFSPKTSDGIFLPENVSGERENLIDEIKSEINNKLSYASKAMNEKMFVGSAYATDELGSESAAESVEPHSLYKFYKKIISRAQCEVFFCGRYSFEEVEREVKRIFSLCKRELPMKIESEPLRYAKDIRVCERMQVSQANLIIGMYSENPDVYLLKLLAAVIGGGTTSKLFENVREKKSLCYFAGAMFDSFKRSLVMYCGIDPKNAALAEDALLSEFGNCIEGNITDDEVANAKKGMIDDLLTTEDSVYAMEAFWLRSALANDDRTPLEVADAINKIDAGALSRAAGEVKKSVTYLLTGLEGSFDERKLLPDA